MVSAMLTQQISCIVLETNFKSSVLPSSLSTKKGFQGEIASCSISILFPAPEKQIRILKFNLQIDHLPNHKSSSQKYILIRQLSKLFYKHSKEKKINSTKKAKKS